jgi:hypothetical protein
MDSTTPATDSASGLPAAKHPARDPADRHPDGRRAGDLGKSTARLGDETETVVQRRAGGPIDNQTAQANDDG